MFIQTPTLGYQGLLAEDHLRDLLRDAGADREEVLRHHLELRRSRTSAGPRPSARLAAHRQKVQVAIVGYLTRPKRVKVGHSRSSGSMVRPGYDSGGSSGGDGNIGSSNSENRVQVR